MVIDRCLEFSGATSDVYACLCVCACGYGRSGSRRGVTGCRFRSATTSSTSSVWRGVVSSRVLRNHQPPQNKAAPPHRPRRAPTMALRFYSRIKRKRDISRSTGASSSRRQRNDKRQPVSCPAPPATTVPFRQEKFKMWSASHHRPTADNHEDTKLLCR